MRKHPQVVGHWHTLFEGFATSSLDYYELVKAGIARREIPDLKISREHLNFDICAAPFGTGYFFSWWLARIPRVLLDFGFLFLILLMSDLLVAAFIHGAASEGSGPGIGLVGVFLWPVLFFGMLFGLGAIVRYGNLGLEPTVLFHADHGLLLPARFPGSYVLQ